MGYLYILRKLGFTSFKNNNPQEAEKYFKVVEQLMPSVTENPESNFVAKKNLLVFYMLTNIDKAQAQGDKMLKLKDKLA
jgi:hypothetical protein